MNIGLSFNPFSVPVLIAGIVVLALGIFAWSKGNVQGQRYFAILMFACTLYSFFYTLELSAGTLAEMVFFLRLEYLGAVLMGPMVLFFTLKYTGRPEFLTTGNIMQLLAIPLLLLILVFTNDAHHWFYQSFTTQFNGYFYTLNSEKGWLYWFHQLYSIALVLISNVLLYRMLRNVPPAYFYQVLFVLVGSLSSWSAHLLHLLHIIPLNLDPIPFSFAISGIIIYIGLYRFGLFLNVPVAYKSLFLNISDGVVVVDVTGAVVACNDSAVRMLQLAKGNLGISANKFLHAWPEILTALDTPEERFNIILRREHEGDFRWFSLDCLNNINNEVFLGKILFLRDVTLEKRNEKEIHEKREELDLFFNNTLYGAFFMMLDEPIEWNDQTDKEAMLDYVFEHQRVTRMNQAMLDQYGAKAEDFLGIRPADFFGGDLATARPLWREFFDRGRWKVETREERFDGSEVMFEGDYVVLYDAQGRIRGHFGVQQDVTERKKAEEGIVASEKKARTLARQYKSILDSQSVYVLKADIEGNYTYVNEYFLNQFSPGRSPEGPFFREIVIADEYPKLRAVLDKCFLQPEVSHEVILRKPDHAGKLKAGKWELKGVLNEKGLLSEILCIGFDITEQVESLDKANELLEVISDQNTKLKSFTYIVSHNIRSHSANLSGLLGVFKDAKSPEEKELILGMLETSTNRLDETIRNLNQIITINENPAKIRIAKPLRREVEKTLEILNGTIAKYHIRTVINIPEHLAVTVVPSYLDSILLNLISNAIKYRAMDRDARIEICAEKRDAWIILAVKDNGLGIDLARHGSKLFGMYKTFHRNEDARGFGLFITKNQVEAMGGKIEVESQENVGSTFRVYFVDRD